MNWPERLGPACLARAIAIDDAPFRQIIWRKFDVYAIAGKNFDAGVLKRWKYGPFFRLRNRPLERSRFRQQYLTIHRLMQGKNQCGLKWLRLPEGKR